MYTILMKDDKRLVTTNKVTLYQREKGVDKIRFLVPRTYKDLNLSECTAILKYVDQVNSAGPEILIPEADLYKERIDYRLPVDTSFTKFAGDIKIRITFICVNPENGMSEEVLHTGETTVTINPLSDYFEYIPDKFLEVIDQKIAKIDVAGKGYAALANSINENKADNIRYNEEENSLQLLSGDKTVGDKVVISGAVTEDGLPVVEFDTVTPDSPDDGEVPGGDVYYGVIEF